MGEYLQRTLDGGAEAVPAGPVPRLGMIMDRSRWRLWRVEWSIYTGAAVEVIAPDEESVEEWADGENPENYAYGSSDVDMQIYCERPPKEAKSEHAGWLWPDGEMRTKPVPAMQGELNIAMVREEIARRARDDYAHLTEGHAQRCAERDLIRDIETGNWPTEEYWEEVGC